MTVSPPRRSVVVLALGRDPLPPDLDAAAASWRERGVECVLVALTPRAPLVDGGTVITLLQRPRGADGRDPSTTGAPRSVPRKVLRRLRLDPVRWPALALCLGSAPARAALGEADVVLAVDRPAALTGWLARRLARASHVVTSIAAATRRLEADQAR